MCLPVLCLSHTCAVSIFSCVHTCVLCPYLCCVHFFLALWLNKEVCAFVSNVTIDRPRLTPVLKKIADPCSKPVIYGSIPNSPLLVVCLYYWHQVWQECYKVLYYQCWRSWGSAVLRLVPVNTGSQHQESASLEHWAMSITASQRWRLSRQGEGREGVEVVGGRVKHREDQACEGRHRQWQSLLPNPECYPKSLPTGASSVLHSFKSRHRSK